MSCASYKFPPLVGFLIACFVGTWEFNWWLLSPEALMQS